MKDKVYDKRFFEAQQDGSMRSAHQIIPILQKLVQPGSVLDVGCGTGSWLSVFKELGTEEVFGIDGDYVDVDMLHIPQQNFMSYDLTSSLNLHKQFDLVISLEVGEHLPSSHAKAFVQSLVRHSSLVLFSAAIPYQGGKNHINEQWPDYWARLFMDEGYVAIDCIRKRIWDDPQVQWWYAQNMILYVKKDQLHNYPLLAKELASNPSGSLSLVHPRLYMLLSKDFFGDDGYKDGMIIGREFTSRLE